MTINYPYDFAVEMKRSIQLWANGNAAVLDLSITLDDWMIDPKNRYSEGKRHKYTDDEIKGLWKCVELARKKMMAFYLVNQGKAIALNPALEMIG